MKSCEFCAEGSSKYKCPKCLRNYCSVACYKCEGHLECSEKFYKDCFMEGLKEEGMEGREEMARMLKEVGGVDERVPDEELEKRFKLLGLGREEEEMWGLLGGQEKAEFICMHSTQDFSSIVHTWQPWWVQPLPKLVQDDKELNKLMEDIPKLFIPQTINSLISLKSPSKSIPFDILNTLYGYCYVCRLHNGDLDDLLVDAADTFSSLSSSLLTHSFDNPSTSIDHCLHNLHKNQPAEIFFVSDQFSLAVINDVACILKGASVFIPNLYIKAALSHSRSLFRKACKTMKKDQSIEGHLSRSQMFMKAFKKIEFYLSWMGSGDGNMEGVAGLLEIALHSKMLEFKKREAQKEVIETHMHKLKPKIHRTLIEEV